MGFFFPLCSFSYRHEISIHHKFDHPNIAPLLDHQISRPNSHVFHRNLQETPSFYEEVFMLFPLYLGTLNDVIQEALISGHPLSEKRIFLIFKQICCAVSEIHHLDPPLAHRDINPRNILMKQVL